MVIIAITVLLTSAGSSIVVVAVVVVGSMLQLIGLHRREQCMDLSLVVAIEIAVAVAVDNVERLQPAYP